MDVEHLRAYCLAKKGTTEDFPFDEITLTFKVMGKIYAICSLNEEELRVNLKCDPEKAVELRERYPDIIPGWHMNKKHWNTVYFERELDEKKIKQLIDHSYDLVVSKFSKALKEALLNL